MTLSISVPGDRYFSDNDEQVRSTRTVARRLARHDGGVGRWPVTVQSFSIAVRQVHLVLGQVYTIAGVALQPGGERGVQLTRRTTTTARCRWSPMC
ncbi:hypothetical protein FKF78_11865 [Aeromonas hydrophila]|nr:hypothetical protein [Aeromonas hydrophila]